MNVLMHIPRAWGGGLEIHVVHLSLLLRSRGARVTLVVHPRFGTESARRNALGAAGIDCLRLPDLDRLPTLLRIALSRTYLRTRLAPEYDLVLCHGTGGSHRWFHRFVRPGGRFVWHDHMSGTRLDAPPLVFEQPVLQPYSGRVLAAARQADFALVGSDHGRRNLAVVQKLPCPVWVLPPLREFLPLPEVVDRPSGGAVLRLSVLGALDDRKGVIPLLKLWRSLRIGPARLTFHGPDPGDRYAAFARTLGLQASVRFAGPYQSADTPRILAETDLGLILSFAEGYPLTTLEFMAHGVPFVMTDVGAGPELTADNPDAVLANLSDRGVARAVEELAVRVRAGETSRRRLHAHYLEHFSFRSAADQYLRLLAPLPTQ
jgi:glycosyltransferase involved in cell wall biosynthesis